VAWQSIQKKKDSLTYYSMDEVLMYDGVEPSRDMAQPRPGSRI
jgi:hypothetical protein